MQTRIGVLRGGVENYTRSIKEGGDLIAYISENLSPKWKPVDILIDRDGVWHVAGLPIQPADLMHRVDVVWNKADGELSRTLESFAIPTVGGQIFSEFLGKNRKVLEQHIKNINVKMPRRIILPFFQEDFDGPRERYAIKKAKEVHEKFPAPWIVKSFTDDRDMGIHVAKTFGELAGAIEDGVVHGTHAKAGQASILVEELITGKNATVHSLSSFRGEDVYTLPFGIHAPHLTPVEKEKLANLSKSMHSHLRAKHYLKVDFVLHRNGQVYLTGMEFSPDLDADSSFCRSCESSGSKAHHVIDHLLEKTIR